jgi:TRAP-type C4-dicarboxylate transport system substrate-binding protein
MTEMRNFEKEISRETDGQIAFKIYANAVQGSEKDVLRKMKLGQIDASTFTGVGLGEIVPEVRILDLPFLFRNSGEIDYVYSNLYDDFQEKFQEKGFYLVGWAEVGLVYLFTKKPVTTVADFRDVKMWLWKGDPLAKATFDVMNITSIPLDITDVHTSLQTGLIDGVYISPYGVMALQWFVRTNYILDYPLTNSVGAVLMTTRKLHTLPEDLRDLLIERTKENMRKIVVNSRKDNRESLEVLQEAGLELLPPRDQVAIAEFNHAGKIVREKLVGSLYSQELLDKVLRLLAEYRSSNGS